MGNTSSDLSKKYKKVSPVREVMSLLVRNKAAMAGLIFLILLVGVSLSADLLSITKARLWSRTFLSGSSGLQ